MNRKKRKSEWYLDTQESDDLYILSIADAAPVSVAYNTAFADVTKPASVNVTLSDLSVVPASPNWQEGTYDQLAAGDYDIYGLVTIPGVSNPFLIKAHFVLTVQQQVFTQLFTSPTGFSTYEILAGVTSLTKIELIGGGASGGSIGTINRAPGSGGGSYKYKDNQAVTAGTIVAVYIAPARSAIAPAGANQEGEDGFASYFGPAAPAGSTILSGTGAPGAGVGVDGNYYSDIATGNFYGPKAAGAWPASSGGPWCRAVGGKKGTGISPGVGGLGGLSADGIGDGGYDGGAGIPAPASRSGAGGGAGNPSGAGQPGTTTGGTNSVGGTSVAPGGKGGNGSSGTPGAADDYGGGAAGARSTVVADVLGGTGRQGYGKLTFSGASVPPIEPGDVHFIVGAGQSNECSPGNGDPDIDLQGPQDTQIYINSTDGYEPLEWGVNNNLGGTPDGLGPELSMCKALALLAPGETYFYKKAQSGTSMHTNWNVANNSTGRSAITQLIAALNYLQDQGKVIRTITWQFMQAEADMAASNPNGPTGSNVQAEYRNKEGDLIKSIIDRLSLSRAAGGCNLDMTVVRLHFIDVLLGDNYVGVDTTFKDFINAAKVDLMANFNTIYPTYATKFAGGYTVNPNGYGRFDGIHYTTDSAEQVGEDCAALVTWIP